MSKRIWSLALALTALVALAPAAHASAFSSCQGEAPTQMSCTGPPFVTTRTTLNVGSYVDNEQPFVGRITVTALTPTASKVSVCDYAYVALPDQYPEPICTFSGNGYVLIGQTVTMNATVTTVAVGMGPVAIGSWFAYASDVTLPRTG